MKCKSVHIVTVHFSYLSLSLSLSKSLWSFLHCLNLSCSVPHCWLIIRSRFNTRYWTKTDDRLVVPGHSGETLLSLYSSKDFVQRLLVVCGQTPHDQEVGLFQSFFLITKTPWTLINPSLSFSVSSFFEFKCREHSDLWCLIKNNPFLHQWRTQYNTWRKPDAEVLLHWDRRLFRVRGIRKEVLQISSLSKKLKTKIKENNSLKSFFNYSIISFLPEKTFLCLHCRATKQVC